MSEPTPEIATPAPTSEPETPATDAPSKELPAELGDAGKRAIDAMKAERDQARREARANAEAAKQYAEFQESQKTEQQKVADRAAAAERERDEARAEGLRYKAAATHGISNDYFDLLGTGNEEEIAARAERIGGLLKIAAENEQLKTELEALRAGKPVPAQQQPVEQLRPGASPVTVPPLGEAEYPSHWFPKKDR
jgi:membrane protein involved in colicin uptake